MSSNSIEETLARFGPEIEVERKKLLVKAAKKTVSSTVVIPLVCGFVYYPHVDNILLFTWIAFMLVTACFRIYSVMTASKTDLDIPENLAKVHKLTMTGVIMNSVFWVIGIALLSTPDKPALMAFLAMLGIITVCGGTVSLSVYRKAFNIYVPPVNLALVVTYGWAGIAPAMNGVYTGIIISLALLMLLVVMRGLANTSENTLIEQIGLKFNNDVLVAEMAEAKGRSEAEKIEQQKRRERLENLTNKFDLEISSILSAVSSAATELEATAQTMTQMADMTENKSGDVTKASTGATNNVQTVAAAAEELSASIQEINRQVEGAATIAGRAVSEAEKTHHTVDGLAIAADTISEVVIMIADIARQTNMLAMNATIEAERAGEAGKGFAVVASEVKNLASQTAKATDDISEQAARIQTESKSAVNAIQEISSTIQEIDEIAASISTSMDEQGQATREISNSVQQAAGGTNQVASLIGDVSAAATENRYAADDVLAAAAELSQQADVLKNQVSGFLDNVRES